MAKPAKTKKNQDTAAPSKKSAGKSAEKGAKGKAKVTPVKGKGKAVQAKGKAKKPEAGGLKARMSKTQALKAKPSKGAGTREKRSATKFLREVRLELSKVTWPTREELIQSTIVVLVAVVIAGIYIAFFDEIFSRIIKFLTTVG